MKVKELIEKLNKINPELDVFCYTEDEHLQAEEHTFRILEFDFGNNIDVSQAEKLRDDDRVPTLKFGKSKYSQEIALINVTSIF